jgi:hypothetical protein
VFRLNESTDTASSGLLLPTSDQVHAAGHHSCNTFEDSPQRATRGYLVHVLYGVIVATSNLLMLATMTFNVGIFVAICIGALTHLLARLLACMPAEMVAWVALACSSMQTSAFDVAVVLLTNAANPSGFVCCRMFSFLNSWLYAQQQCP